MASLKHLQVGGSNLPVVLAGVHAQDGNAVMWDTCCCAGSRLLWYQIGPQQNPGVETV